MTSSNSDAEARLSAWRKIRAVLWIFGVATAAALTYLVSSDGEAIPSWITIPYGVMLAGLELSFLALVVQLVWRTLHSKK